MTKRRGDREPGGRRGYEAEAEAEGEAAGDADGDEDSEGAASEGDDNGTGNVGLGATVGCAKSFDG